MDVQLHPEAATIAKEPSLAIIMQVFGAKNGPKIVYYARC